MRRILPVLALAVIALATALVVNTLRFTSRQVPAEPLAAAAVDATGAARRLSEALRFRTVSYQDPVPAGSSDFRGLHEHLEKAFPKVHATLRKELVGDYSLLYTWTGTDPSLDPILLAGHQDVVPVDPATEGGWSHPPFDGHVADGYVWGRGAMDDKSGVLGILEAVETLVAEGYRPRRTVLLAFGHDEEVGGHEGAAQIAALLRGRGLKLDYVLDEGLIIAEGVLPVPHPIAFVGIAEKGSLSLELSVDGEGGHSSMPPTQTAIGVLGAAVGRLEAHPMPAGIHGVARQTLDYVGPEMSWGKRLVFANLWLFAPLLERRFSMRPDTNAAIRTTTAVTIIEGGIKDNVLPTRARAVVNLRTLPGDGIEKVIAHVREAVGDPRVRIERHGSMAWEASPISGTESHGFRVLERTIRQAFPDTIVAPALVLGATDSRHYVGLTKDVYRFLPQRYLPGDAKRYHGTDERISIENYGQCIRFYRELVRGSTSTSSR